MMAPQLVLALIEAGPYVASQALSWYVRITQDNEIRSMPDGPEKEAAIQAKLDELSTQSAELQAIIDARRAGS